MTPHDEASSTEAPAPANGREATAPGRLARWLPILTNGGALIGLLLVVVQLQQNRDLVRAP